jgi:MFS family permease
VSTLPDVRGAPPSTGALDAAPSSLRDLAPSNWPRRLWRRIGALDPRWKYPIAVYLLSRVLYLAVALIDTVARHGLDGQGWNLAHETSNWDGAWYVALAGHGYPSHLIRLRYSTLGFFPLYPTVMRGLSAVLGISNVWSGLIVSIVLGGVTTVLVGRLAERWFGHAAGRRAVLFFCLFPGSIVFSMDYAEGLMLACVAGAMLAVEHRRWLLAGILAGVATAVGPVALAIVPAALAVCVRELHRNGWRARDGWGAAPFPLLAPVGIVTFGAYLWARVGTPFASYISQQDAWQEHSSPFALYDQARTLFDEIFHPAPGVPPPSLNIIVGLLGLVFLVWGLSSVWRTRRSVPLVAVVWTLGVTFLTITSAQVPPNPRMLLCAFPILIVLAARLEGRAYRRLIAATTVLLVGLSVLTFVSTSLRP